MSDWQSYHTLLLMEPVCGGRGTLCLSVALLKEAVSSSNMAGTLLNIFTKSAFTEHIFSTLSSEIPFPQE